MNPPFAVSCGLGVAAPAACGSLLWRKAAFVITTIQDAAARRALLLRMAAVQPPACLADLNDDLLRKIASRLAESELASAVALKRCSSRFKDLAAPLVANAVSVTNEKWRDAAAKVGCRVGAKITGALERNEVPTSLDVRGNKIGRTGATAIADALKGTAVLTNLYIGYSSFGYSSIGYSSIGNEGAKALAPPLCASTR